MNSIFGNYIPKLIEEAWVGMNGNPNIILCLCERGNLDKDAVRLALESKYPGTKWRALNSVKGGFQLYYPEGLSHKVAVKDRGTSINIHVSSKSGPPSTWSAWFVHLPTKIFKRSWDVASTREAEQFRVLVEASERGKRGVICLGDFNTNPYDVAMASPLGMNAAMCRNVAARKEPTILKNGKKASIKWFFNPMWSLMGDQLSGKQPGTFSLDIEESDSRYWVMPDQVIVRPQNATDIADGWPKIFSSVSGAQSLLTSRAKGIDKTISDHLPIGVMLKI